MRDPVLVFFAAWVGLFALLLLVALIFTRKDNL